MMFVPLTRKDIYHDQPFNSKAIKDIFFNHISTKAAKLVSVTKRSPVTGRGGPRGSG